MKQFYEDRFETTRIGAYEIDYCGNNVRHFRSVSIKYEMGSHYESSIIGNDFGMEMFCDTHITRIA